MENGTPNISELALNRHVEMMLTMQHLAVDEMYAWDQFTNYMQEVYLRALGIPYAELGISQRREKSMPSIFEPIAQEGKFQTVSGGKLYYESKTAPGSIAHLKVRGVMQLEGGMSTRGIEDFVDDMRAAYNNDNISAVVIDVNSGGGAMSAGDAARGVVEERNKPVLAMVNMAGSAAYNMIAPADEIIATSKKSSVGSIGTYLTLDTKLIEEIRGRYIEIYADGSPDKNKEWRALKSGDFSLIKAMVNKLNEEFQQSIRDVRPLTGDRLQLKETLDGGMFGAEEALQRGLIDGIGNMPHVLARAMSWTKKRKRAA